MLSSSFSAALPTPTHIQTRPSKLLVAGGRRLSGEVLISGSKNAALPILAGTLLLSSSTSLTVLRGVPDLSDTTAMASVLRSLGARVDRTDVGEILVDAAGVGSAEPCPEEVGRTRAGFLVIGPLLARFGEADVALPGGCDIGARPIDIHLKGLTALGAVVELREGKVHAHAANGKGLVGSRFRLDYPSVGATQTLMMAASMAEGLTTLSNAAWEPEVVSLAVFLNASGACVEGAGTSTVAITGRKRLYGGAEHTIIPDRIEAGTFMAAAAIARSCITLSPVVPSHMISVLEKLSAAGCKITQTGRRALQISAEATGGGTLRGFDLETLPYPGFPTDLQPQFMALLTTCTGSSNVVESVFEKRMHHVEELKKLGAEIKVTGNSALINEGKKAGATLCGGRVNAADLRGGAALVLAGLAAAGVTEVSGAAHIDRGYENFEAKLRSLGADIKRVAEINIST